MLAKDMIHKAITSCQLALDNLEKGNKRKALGDLDFAYDRVTGGKWMLINEIIDEEGKL